MPGLGMKRFGDRLREARIAAGLTQGILGFELGVSKSSVSSWENGRDSPSFRLPPEIGRLLRRSLDDPLRGTSFDSMLASSTPQARSIDPASPAARNPQELALLLRYRRLSASKRGALLELIKPE
jgi:transcriptional regulator with XRE-family HTH domain